VLHSFCDTQFLTNCTIPKQFHSTSPCLLIYMVNPVVIMGHKKKRKEKKRKENWHSTMILTIIEMSHLFHILLLYKHFIYLHMAESQLWLKFWTYHLWLKNPQPFTGWIPGSQSSCFWRTYHRRHASFHAPENRGRASLQNSVEVLASDNGQVLNFSCNYDHKPEMHKFWAPGYPGD
jgi:hypothetical protein